MTYEKERKGKYNRQVSSKIQRSETPHQRERSQIMYSGNEVTGSYETQGVLFRL